MILKTSQGQMMHSILLNLPRPAYDLNLDCLPDARVLWRPQPVAQTSYAWQISSSESWLDPQKECDSRPGAGAS